MLSDTVNRRFYFDPAHIAFWWLGLINNFTFIVFISAAEDTLGGHAGVTLVFTVVPGLISKLLLPFFIHRISFYVRIFIVSLCTTLCSIAVAVTPSVWKKFTILAIQAFIGAMGEITFLALTTRHPSTVVGAWSSGTGGAGIAGAGAYTLLKNVFKLSSRTSLLICSPLPLLMVIIYRIVLHEPSEFQNLQNNEDDEDTANYCEPSVVENNEMTKREYVWTMASTFMIPLATVYFSEYLINEGVLGTLTKFRNKKEYDRARIYTLFQFVYQIGVFTSRSSISVIRFRALWLLALLQFMNLIFFSMSSIFVLLPSRSIALLFILWEGLLGGWTYVNAFFLLRTEAPEHLREWAIGTVTVADTLGISLAAVTSVWLEQAILKTRS